MSDELKKDLKEYAPALVVGDQVFVSALYAGNKPFVFTRTQMEFMLALRKMQNVEVAALSVSKDAIWAKAFLSSKKFKTFVNAKMQEFSIKNGLTIEWWYQFGKWLAEGKKESYKGMCPFCNHSQTLTSYEAEVYRKDDMSFEFPCEVCFKPVVLTAIEEEFRPTREQVEGWKEIGSRLLPKVERVHHQFSKEEFVFESESQEGK